MQIILPTGCVDAALTHSFCSESVHTLSSSQDSDCLSTLISDHIQLSLTLLSFPPHWLSGFLTAGLGVMASSCRFQEHATVQALSFRDFVYSLDVDTVFRNYQNTCLRLQTLGGVVSSCHQNLLQCIASFIMLRLDTYSVVPQQACRMLCHRFQKLNIGHCA